MNYTNFGLEKNVEILSAHHVERFTQLRENEQKGSSLPGLSIWQ